MEAAVQKTVESSNGMMAIDDPREARRIIRAGDYSGHTAGIAPDYVQGNLCILPRTWRWSSPPSASATPSPVR